jgi:hypothetical protein
MRRRPRSTAQQPDPRRKALMVRSASRDHPPSTLSPSLSQDLRGALAPRRTTWRQAAVASVTGLAAAVGLGLLAAGWLKSRALGVRHRWQTSPW